MAFSLEGIGEEWSKLAEIHPLFPPGLILLVIYVGIELAYWAFNKGGRNGD